MAMSATTLVAIMSMLAMSGIVAVSRGFAPMMVMPAMLMAFCVVMMLLGTMIMVALSSTRWQSAHNGEQNGAYDDWKCSHGLVDSLIHLSDERSRDPIQRNLFTR